MRIQHNIMAMNAYRNYSNNTSALSKNLEKLSSGYKINRAGDDAAGLAISEKMRAQITGLEGAQKNAKDGISLVQTAEGALTEVHDMLNRMYSLAEQSANGTYENETDRAQLQKEVTELKTEIDRIADSANFNGIKLLNGDLGSTGASGVAVNVQYDNLSNNADLLKLNSATAAKSTAAFDSTKLTGNKEYTISVTYSDASGNLQSKDVTFKAAGNTAGNNDTVIQDALQKAFGDDFTVAVATDALTVTANDKGAANKLEIFKLDIKDDTGASVSQGIKTAPNNTVGTDAYYTLDATKLTVFNGTGDADIFEINGQKFAFATADGAKKLDPDVNYIETTNTTAQTADVASMIKLINNKTGIGAVANATDTSIDLKAGTKAGTTGNGLTLQIGDTGDSFNQLTVSIDDCHAQAIGVGGVDIGTQAGAQAALKTIEDAINYVSNVRGGLGATQNRLDHTINNLSVMQENIQDAESSIRDTDVADEMMAYTKNNILIQSAQAMLAQANQVPQGVLQLLQ